MDYTFTSNDLPFNATMSSETVTIPIIEDTIVESSETIIVTLISADPAAILNPQSATVTIEDNDGKQLYMLIMFSVKMKPLNGVYISG